MFHSLNIQSEKSYGNGSDMEKFAVETDIKISDGNDLIAKANVLKRFEKIDFIGIFFIIKFHSEQLLWQSSDFKSPTINKKRYLLVVSKHVLCWDDDISSCGSLD